MTRLGYTATARLADSAQGLLIALMVERVVFLAAGARANGEFAVGDRSLVPAGRNRLLK